MPPARSITRSARFWLALRDAGFADNTLVICTTDHGVALPSMKCNLTDHGIGVMLILHGPQGSGPDSVSFAAGRVIDAMVSHIDVFPTVCELAGLEPPDWLQGRSMMPLFRGETDTIRDEIFAEVNFHAAYEAQRCVRTERWKYIRRYHPRQQPLLPNCDDGPSKRFWGEHGWRDRMIPEERLYDLVFDPHESCNLAADGDRHDVLEAMRSRLDRWMKETNDPLLDGVVIPPEDALINQPDADSPNDKRFPATHI